MNRVTEPPLYVPTLTEIVHPAPASEFAFSAPTALPNVFSFETQELMVQRVLQRIDRMLEQRLHEAIEQLILEHTDALMPRLREEIELVVRESVLRAFEQETVPARPDMKP